MKAKMVIIEKNYFLYEKVIDVIEGKYELIETIGTNELYLKNE